MTFSNRIGYFWLGAAVGAAAATLCAPKRGAQTRKYCQTRIQEAADMLTRQAEDMRELAVKTVERGARGVDHQLSKLSGAINAGRRALKKAS